MVQNTHPRTHSPWKSITQLVLGVCASLIPYPEHNSTPRVTGGTAMVKQLGLPSSNYRLRPDTRAHILHYPQRSIPEPEQWKQQISTSAPVVNETSSLQLCRYTWLQHAGCNHEPRLD